MYSHHETVAWYLTQLSILEVSTLIEEHLGMVVKTAKRYAKDPEELLDKIQDGNVGLCKALQTYDPSKGEFNTWALFHIKSEIRNRLTDQLGQPLRHRKDLVELVDITDLPLEANDPIEDIQQSMALAAASRLLTQKQRFVVQGRLNGCTYQELADSIGSSHQNIQCIERSALKRITTL